MAKKKILLKSDHGFSSALYMENFPHGPQGSVLRGKYCYVEFLHEHSPVFSDVLRSHMTSSHPFRPTRPIEILTSSGFHNLSSTFPHLHHIGQSWNVIRNITDIFRYFYHLNHALILRRFQYYTFHSRLYYYSVVALSLVV